MLQIGGGGRARLKEGEIELRRVGIGSLRDVSSFGAAFANLTQYRAQASLVTSTVLLAPDSIALEHDPALQYLVRTRSWVAPIDPATIASWQIGGILERESQAQTRLQLADPAFTLTGPDEALLGARQRNDVHGSRMVLVGGTVSALLLGFALLAAAGLRRSFSSERRRLVQRGASRPQIWLAAFTEIGAITLAGWLVGIALGAAAVGILADRLDVPAGATLRHALLEPWSLFVLVAGWAVATALISAVTLAGDETGPRRRIRLLDVVAVGAVLAVVVGVTRGDLDSDTLASGGGDETLLLLLPGLVCLAGAVLAARLLAPLMRLAERTTRRSGGAAAARGPGARPCSGEDGRRRRLRRRLRRPRALRVRVPPDAPARRPGRGGVRGSARRDADRGLEARPAGRCRDARGLRAPRVRRSRVSGVAPRGRCRRRRVERVERHGARPGAGGARPHALARRLLAFFALAPRQPGRRGRTGRVARSRTSERPAADSDERAPAGHAAPRRDRRAAAERRDRHDPALDGQTPAIRCSDGASA